MYESEKTYTRYLDKHSIKWVYPVKLFRIGRVSYRPDFFLPESNEYVEVVGSLGAYYRNWRKYKLFRHYYPNLKFSIVSPDGLSFIKIVGKANKRRLKQYVIRTQGFYKFQLEKLDQVGKKLRRYRADLFREAVEDLLKKYKA